ncbi:MAG: ATP-grasp domain-containing protein [Labilithrix sp.]|nr:ATP-grasp domain-containing protein [Labilithrix sp.]
MSSLLVLGASRYQLDVIRRAKELGHRVVTTDNVPTNPGHALADASYEVDTTDFDGVLGVARREGIAGVVAPCTDVAVATAAHVAGALGLPAIPLESAKTLTSKVLFRRFLASEGLPAPRFVQVAAGDDDAIELPGPFPLIVKPEGSSGSKGVFIVRTEPELRERLPATLAFSPTRVAIVEELVYGRQGTCEGVVIDGSIAFSVVTDRETAKAPFVATAAHFVPAAIAPERTTALIAQILAKHGIARAVFDCDFVVAADGTPHVLELTPRLGGNALTRLVNEATGIDLAEIAVRLACGSDVSFARAVAARPVAQLILGVERAGKLSFDASEVDRLKQEPWVRALSFDYAIGEPVEAFINGRTRVGEATLRAESRRELDARVAELRARMKLGVDP